jgi:hypothetical protein
VIAQLVRHRVVGFGQIGLQVVHNVRVVARHERGGQTRLTCAARTTNTMRVG